MDKLDLNDVRRYVNENIDTFHNSRIARIKKVSLNDVLRRKNPYLFRAKNIRSAADLVDSILNAYLSSSEEELFGVFLEGLAIFVAEKSLGGKKSAATGIDLEFEKEGTKYVVAIKSGQNWGNSSQYSALRNNFKNAVRVLRQSRAVRNVQPVLGMCYGKMKTVDTGDYLKIAGQNFWQFISGNPRLYIDIIEPIGYQAKQHNEDYEDEKAAVVNLFTKEFSEEFCTSVGKIDWSKLVKFNSGNPEPRK